MKIILLGAAGRLGAALLREYRGKFDVTSFGHAQLDLGDLGAVRRTLGETKFDVLINAAAFTNVDLCEKEREKAFQINAEAPRILAEVCDSQNAKLIHFSTDYVFDGKKREPYVEEDPAQPISVYGESKLAGERNVLGVNDRHLVVRVSWVFGPDRPSFVDAMIKRAQESEKVEAIADKYSTPTYTLDIARMLERAIGEKAVALSAPAGTKPNTDRYTGILHFSNSGECSWQEFAQHALECCKLTGVALKCDEVGPLKLADMESFTARRPVYSVLSPARYGTLTGTPPRAWREAVADYILESFHSKK